MKRGALHTLLRLREYALEKEEQKLAERTREELMKQRDCANSQADLEMSYDHTVEDARASDYLRRDKCVREAGNRHIMDLRQLALVQRARHAQIQATLAAKQRADMIAKVIDNRRVTYLADQDLKERKRMDDISQNLYLYNQDRTI